MAERRGPGIVVGLLHARRRQQCDEGTYEYHVSFLFHLIFNFSNHDDAIIIIIYSVLVGTIFSYFLLVCES